MSEPCAKGHHHPDVVRILAPWGSTYWGCPEHADQIERELRMTEARVERPRLVEEVVSAAEDLLQRLDAKEPHEVDTSRLRTALAKANA